MCVMLPCVLVCRSVIQACVCVLCCPVHVYSVS